MAVTITAVQLTGRIAGAAKDSNVAIELLAMATARIDREAPGGPDAIANEAVVRYAGYMAQSDYGGVVSEQIEPRHVTYTTNHSNAWRNSGAAGLLSRGGCAGPG